ncbi:hypothetical protein ACA910_003742 [Epithemia clementina (nom. ined.)]
MAISDGSPLRQDSLTHGKIVGLCKVARLGSASLAVCQSEVLLCALLLWIRIHDDKTFCQVAKSASTRILVQFCLTILQNYSKLYRDSTATLSGGQQQQAPVSTLLVRLASQIVARCFWIIDSTNTTETETPRSTRLLDKKGDHATVDLWQEHVDCLVHILQLRRTNQQPITTMDIEMLLALRNLTALLCSLPYSGTSRKDELLSSIWNIYKDSSLQQSLGRPPAFSISHAESAPTENPSATRYESTKQEETNDQKLMIDTLDALLQQSSTVGDWVVSKDGAVVDSSEVWEEMMWDILDPRPVVQTYNNPEIDNNHNLIPTVSMPAFWVDALSWFLNLDKEHGAMTYQTKSRDEGDEDDSKTDGVFLSPLTRAKLAKMLLHHVHVLFSSYQSNQNEDILMFSFSSSSSSPSSTTDPTLLIRLLLISVVTPSNEVPDLRPLAWTVACQVWSALLNTVGLGSRQVCSLLRLSVGEWNIQLDNLLRCYQDMTIDTVATTPTATAALSKVDSAVLLLSACGRIVTQTNEFITKLDEHEGQLAHQSLNMSKSSIHHVRRSLEQALDLCVLYFQEMRDNIVMAQHPPNEAVVAVFGSLITEFDVFTHHQHDNCAERNVGDQQQEQNQVEQATTNNTALILALEQATTMVSADVNLSTSLLPGVTTVLASSQGDPERVCLIKNWKDIICNLVTTFWKSNERMLLQAANTATKKDNHTSYSSVVWVCQLMELVVDIFGFPLSDSLIVGSWKNQLISFLQLQAAVQGKRNFEKNADRAAALNAAVACYITLQGETPPPDSQAAILQQIMSELPQE